MQNNGQRAIYREQALQHYYSSSRQKEVSDEIRSPVMVVFLWVLLGVCLLAGGLFWWIWLKAIF